MSQWWRDSRIQKAYNLGLCRYRLNARFLYIPLYIFLIYPQFFTSRDFQGFEQLGL